MNCYAKHRQVSQFQPSKAACAAFALQSAERAFGTLHDLPYGALHTVGGLSVDTALELEGFIHLLAAEGIPHPTVPRVMAELDIHGMIS